MESKIVAAYKFFREHADYCVGFSAINALDLARSEAWAAEQEITFDWEDSPSPWPSGSRRPIPLMDVVMRDKDGSVIGSIGMVNEYPGGHYFRVIEAQLASEYRAEQEDEARNRASAANQNIRTAS